jgi:hypothetical protein
MKKLHTSYYARCGKHPDAVAISVKSPSFYQGKKYLPLAPSWELLRAYKAGQVDEKGYTEWYLRLLQERNLTPRQIVDDLDDGSILLCYEGPNKFCHRHIVAVWLEEGAEVEVTEINTDPLNIVDELFEF